MRFVLIDTNNLVHRMKHVVKHYDGFDEAVSMILTNVFTALRKSYEKFGARHVVACFDSYSWRSDYFPEYKALCQAEEINHTLHNLYTLRGAQVRHGLKWSKYDQQLNIDLYARRFDIEGSEWFKVDRSFYSKGGDWGRIGLRLPHNPEFDGLYRLRVKAGVLKKGVLHY